MIELAKDLYLGEGHQRVCYRHPTDSGLCIKVLKPRKSAVRQHNQELLELGKLKGVQGASGYVTAQVAEVLTSEGVGYVFPMLADANGRQARSLSAFLKSDLYERDEVERRLKNLGEFLLRHCIVFRDINASNILCPVNADGGYQLIVIDGVGDRVEYPLNLMNKVPILARRKIRRRWRKVMEGLHQTTSWIDVEALAL